MAAVMGGDDEMTDTPYQPPWRGDGEMTDIPYQPPWRGMTVVMGG